MGNGLRMKETFMVVHLIVSIIEERLLFRKRELRRLQTEQTNLV